MMLKLKHIVAFLLILVLHNQTMAQCPFGGTLLTNVNPTGAGFTSSHTIRGGYYVTVAVCSGATYTFETCSNAAFDTQITVYNEATSAFISYNDDGCGTQSTITWIASFTGTIRVMVNRYSCLNTGAGLTTTLIVNQTAACGATVPPANDNCTGALPIICGQTITGSTTDASPDIMVTGCGNSTSPSEWYVFTGNGQNIVASLCGSGYDTYLSVVTGACGGTQTCVAFNDDSCGPQSQVSFTSVAGVLYYIRVAGYGTASGNYSLALNCFAPIANDACSGALPITCGQTITGSTLGAFPEPNVTGCGNATSPTLWYSFVGTGQLTTVSLCGSAFDTQLGILTGACSGTLNCVAGNDDFCGIQSQISFSSVAGQTYFFRVGGIGTTSGNFSLAVTCVTETGNDPCSGAIPITCGTTITGTTVGLNIDAIPAGCGLSNSAGAWYSFVGDGQMATLNTCTTTSFDTQISVFNGTCAALFCIATNDQFCGNQSQVTFLTSSGVTYYVLVHGASATGAFTLDFDCTPYVPAPQDCQGANTVCNDQQFNGNSSGFGVTQEINSGNAGCLSMEHQSSWYIFSPTTTGTIAFAINPTPVVDYDFAVWGPFSSVACPPSGAPLRCSFSATAAVTGLGNGATDFTEGVAGNAWVAPITVGAAELNQVYIMLLDNFSQSSTPFVFDWSLGGVALDCSIQLPVVYTAWRGDALPQVNRLFWSTATESMNEQFIIERSSDNKNFEYIGSMLGHGTSLQAHEYSFDDAQPLHGISYYRLKQMDWNGDTHFSDVITVERPIYFSLAPNPADAFVNVVFSSQQLAATIDLCDMCGRTIIRQQVEHSNAGLSFTIDLSNVKPGAYAVVMRSSQGQTLQQARLIVR